MCRAVYDQRAAVVQADKVACTAEDAPDAELAVVLIQHDVIFCVGALQPVADQQVAVLYRGEHTVARCLCEHKHLGQQHPYDDGQQHHPAD